MIWTAIIVTALIAFVIGREIGYHYGHEQGFTEGERAMKEHLCRMLYGSHGTR